MSRLMILSEKELCAWQSDPKFKMFKKALADLTAKDCNITVIIQDSSGELLYTISASN